MMMVTMNMRNEDTYDFVDENHPFMAKEDDVSCPRLGGLSRLSSQPKLMTLNDFMMMTMTVMN